MKEEYKDKTKEQLIKGSGISFKEASARFMNVFGEEERKKLVRPVGVKLVPKGQAIPKGTRAIEGYQGVLWCEAVRIAATKGEVVVINKENVGCPAAAIALGLVDQYQKEPLSGKRKYTDLMSEPAAPADFTNGLVYACKDSGNMQFALFGSDDTGRYGTLGDAQKAVSGMKAIQPPIMDAAVAYQAEKLNGSFFCLGARALGGWSGNLLGLGMPFLIFQQMVTGMEKSANGFPYEAYPE